MEPIEITFFEYDITNTFKIDKEDKQYINCIKGLFSTDMIPQIHGYQKYALCKKENLIFYINSPCHVSDTQIQEIKDLLASKYSQQLDGYITLNLNTIKSLTHTTKTITITPHQ